MAGLRLKAGGNFTPTQVKAVTDQLGDQIKLVSNVVDQTTGIITPASYTVAQLTALTGLVAPKLAYAKNGRRAGQAANAGTGVMVFLDNTGVWIACDTGLAVTA
ncbi:MULTISPECIES: hypothetical protein [unclassified Rhizobium]|uniref:hypothetical protein n=1 Tax=unclassified Rhizobium TaxID=2613769 RepID=UPI001160CF63|nr:MULTISPECIES: hypothetical protein [unclassified Rhizobium]TQX87146.1 hypothetical protein EQW76_14895 [Rhizobium sp. rho-13.1]TQY14231.1 hypothetical protein EQW74_13725 [Rhizobium sp. rho-1.1]